ncbi:MAG: hypothetical protein LH478_04630, partial [Chitinophagaceae bacterium]|nr:hypothetical protein [Chitinophagaceae bacterium]
LIQLIKNYTIRVNKVIRLEWSVRYFSTKVKRGASQIHPALRRNRACFKKCHWQPQPVPNLFQESNPLQNYVDE